MTLMSRDFETKLILLLRDFDLAGFCHCVILMSFDFEKK